MNSDISGSFPIVNGVKQGCVLAPTLFSIFFCMMLKQLIEDLDDDRAVYIRFQQTLQKSMEQQASEEGH